MPVFSLRSSLLACLLVYLLALSAAVGAEGIDLLGYELRSLSSGEMSALEEHRGNVVVMMFFEPDCPFCARQTQVLQKLQIECSSLQPVAIGVNGSVVRLRQEAKRIRVEFPAYLASGRLNNDVGEIEGTPVMLVADRQGNFVTHLWGLQNEATMRGILEPLLPDCRFFNTDV